MVGFKRAKLRSEFICFAQEHKLGRGAGFCFTKFGVDMVKGAFLMGKYGVCMSINPVGSRLVSA